MCDLQIINTNSFGCILRCSHCENLQLRLGNVLATLDLKDFRLLKWNVENLYVTNYANIVLSGDKVYLNTDSEKFVLALSADELNEMNTLLTEASVMLAVYEILDL